MKLKIILMGLMIGAVLLTQTACSKQPEDISNVINEEETSEAGNEDDSDTTSDAEEVINQDDENQTDDSNAMDEFEALITAADVKLGDVLAFMKSNIESISEENASVMLVRFEEVQIAGRTTLEEKYYPETIQKSFQEAYQNGNNFSKIEELTDASLRELLEETKAGGFKLEQAEGLYYPVIDYSVYQQFASNVTPDIKEYINIMTVESNQVFAKDAALVIEWKEVINRALSLEAFQNTYGDFVKADLINELYQRYERIALFGLNNTPLFDYESNTINEDAKLAYEESLTGDLKSDFLIKLKGFMDIVKANDYKLTEDVEQYRTEATTNEGVVTEENRYSVVGIDNATEFEEAFRLLQELVNKEDKKAVAEYVAYPITVTIDGTRTEIADEAKFIENYDSIMTEAVKSAFINQKVEETFVNYKGVMVGKGEIWLNMLAGTKHKYSIYGINN